MGVRRGGDGKGKGMVLPLPPGIFCPLMEKGLRTPMLVYVSKDIFFTTLRLYLSLIVQKNVMAVRKKLIYI